MIRDPETVIHGGAFPYMGLCPDVEGSARLMAILKVLCCLPDDAYKRLCNSFTDKYSWYIPHYEQLAEVHPFVATDEGGGAIADGSTLVWAPSANVLYLSPRLEEYSRSINIAVVAHELAHVYLDHKLFNSSDEEYAAQEDEAWRKVAEWGFGREAAQHKAMYKARETRERKWLEAGTQVKAGQDS